MKRIFAIFAIIFFFFSTNTFACGEEGRKIFYATPDGKIDRINYDKDLHDYLIEKGKKIGTCGTKCMNSDLHVEDKRDSVEARIVAACQAYEREKDLRKKEEEKEKDRFIKNFLDNL